MEDQSPLPIVAILAHELFFIPERFLKENRAETLGNSEAGPSDSHRRPRRPLGYLYLSKWRKSHSKSFNAVSERTSEIKGNGASSSLSQILSLPIEARTSPQPEPEPQLDYDNQESDEGNIGGKGKGKANVQRMG